MYEYFQLTRHYQSERVVNQFVDVAAIVRDGLDVFIGL